MDLKLLKQKDFFLLMLGKIVSLMGTQMQNFALSLYVLKITGSATKFASVLAVTVIPNILLGPIAGVFADWFDRKKIIVYLDMLRGIIVGAYAVALSLNGELSMMSIYGLVIIMSIASLLFQPAIATVIPSIVEKKDFMEANGTNTFLRNIGNFISPLIAGFLFGMYGIGIIFIINSVSFILSAISEMFINIPKSNKKPQKINMGTFKKDFVEGLQFIKSNKILLTIILLALILNFFMIPLFSVGLTYIAKEVIEVSDSQYGLIQTVLVSAMMISPFLASFVSKKMKLGRLIFYNLMIGTILTVVFGFVSSDIFMRNFETNLIPYISVMVIIFVISMVVGVVNIGISTKFQKVVPLKMMGRTITVMNAGCMAAMPIGQMLLGGAFDKVEAWKCVMVCATAMFIFIMAFRRMLFESDGVKNKECDQKTPVTV